MAKRSSRTQMRKQEQGKKRQRNLVLSGVLGILVLLAAVFAATRGEEPSRGAEVADLPIAPEAGSTAPDFELPSKDGELVNLSDYRGHPVAVTFMHTW